MNINVQKDKRYFFFCRFEIKHGENGKHTLSIKDISMKDAGIIEARFYKK